MYFSQQSELGYGTFALKKVIFVWIKKLCSMALDGNGLEKHKMWTMTMYLCFELPHRELDDHHVGTLAAVNAFHSAGVDL